METTLIDKLGRTKLFLGPMSKNIVDSVINFANTHDYPIGLIASRRQIDYEGGYVNNWTTVDFTNYVRERTTNIILCRDHGGPGQGSIDDNGKISLIDDIQLMDIVHIDPWKKLQYKDAVEYTIDIINKGYDINPSCLYEVGTEQAIYDMNPHLFFTFIEQLKKELKDKFRNVVFGVIQSGTSLEAGKNTGLYSVDRLQYMTNICKRHFIMSKEHNGDYLPASLVKEKFNLGLSAINIAPELANLETKHILEKLPDIDNWFTLLMEDGHWKKWFPKDFDPFQNKLKVVELCGHYVFSDPNFNFDLSNVAEYVGAEIYSFIQERI